jgi:hypothetical protein
MICREGVKRRGELEDDLTLARRMDLFLQSEIARFRDA